MSAVPCDRSPVEIVQLASGWRKCEAAMARRAAEVGLRLAGKNDYTLALVLAGSRKLAELNYRFAGKKTPTDVLAFPAGAAAKAFPGIFLGDVVLARPVLARQAARARLPFLAHLAHLAAHGTLHLLGYDHHAPAAARRMGKAEAAVLARLGLPAPPPPEAFAAKAAGGLS